MRGVLAAVAVVTIVGGAMPAASQRPALAMLDQLEGGRWELRAREPGAPAERLCLRDGRRLIQLRHPQLQCDRFIVSDQPNDVTIQYTCHGSGYGRTHIRRVTEDIVQIEAQGIAGGLPFNFVVDGRRIGECGGA